MNEAKNIKINNPLTIAGSGFCRRFEVTTNQSTMTNLQSQPEIFKPIFGFEGIYEIGNLGTVRTLQRTIHKINGKKQTQPAKIIKPDLNSKGYLRVWLHNKEKNVRALVHRLVGLYFIDNPCPLFFDQINHKDGNKHNCAYWNLEWTNNSGNQIHRHKVLGHKGGNTKKINPCV